MTTEALAPGLAGHLTTNRDFVDAAHAASNGAAQTATVQTGDAAGPLTEGAFDAIWTSDVIWPGNFDDPAAMVAGWRDLSEVERLLTLGNPQYIVDEPGFFVMHPTILATGRHADGFG